MVALRGTSQTGLWLNLSNKNKEGNPGLQGKDLMRLIFIFFLYNY